MANLTVNLSGDSAMVMDLIKRLAQCDKEPISAALEKEIRLSAPLTESIDETVPDDVVNPNKKGK